MTIDVRLPYSFCERCQNKDIDIITVTTIHAQYLHGVCRNEPICTWAVNSYRSEKEDEPDGEVVEVELRQEPPRIEVWTKCDTCAGLERCKRNWAVIDITGGTDKFKHYTAGLNGCPEE